MLKIDIANITIELKFLFSNEFQNLNAYQSGKEAEYFIESFSECYSKPFGKLIKETEYYDLYESEDRRVQVQKQNQSIIGVIEYSQKNINLFLYQKNFGTEYLLSQYALVYILNEKNTSLFIHGSSIVYKNKGILFCAKSGTGKSTHARLWRTYTDAITLNDDKNIILKQQNALVLYPNPWSGKHQLNQAITAPLACIVFLYQAKENEVRQLSVVEAMRLLLGQIDAPTRKNMAHWNEMVDALLELPIYYYGCNMEASAVEVLKKRLEMDLCL